MRHLWTALACVVIGLAARQQAPPVFHTSTQFVAVDVVVTGKDDAPVTDLTKDDFEITENGAPQKISDFAFVSVPLNDRIVDADAPALPPADVASNATSERTSRAIVVVVDDTALTEAVTKQDPPSAELFVELKKILASFLSSLTTDDQVAIVWQSRSDLSQDFTNDIPRLIASVNSRRTAMGLTAIGPTWRGPTFSLKYAVAALAGSPYARRAIVFLGTRACDPASMGTDMEAQECQDLYKRARQADVPIYTLDPRVLPPSPATDQFAELAINTGGLSFTNLSNPVKAMQQILTENGSFYTLGFYPEPLVSDGKYHDIHVTVKRPGVRVRSRDRYLADTAVKPASTPNRDMTAALSAGLDDPGLPVRVSVTPLSPSARLTRSLVTIEVKYPLPDGPSGDIRQLDDELRLGILALSPDAKIKASLQRPIRFTGKWRPDAHGVFVMNDVIDLPAEELIMRVGVTSKALGKTGTAHLSVKVPNYLDNALQLSPIVVGATSTTSDAVTALDFIRALVPFQPTTSRAFAPSDTLRVFARAYWRAADTVADSTLTIAGPSSVPPRHLMLKGTVPSLGRREAVLDTEVPLAGLTPGSYVLHIESRIAKGKPSIRELPFDVK